MRAGDVFQTLCDQTPENNPFEKGGDHVTPVKAEQRSIISSRADAGKDTGKRTCLWKWVMMRHGGYSRSLSFSPHKYSRRADLADFCLNRVENRCTGMLV